MRTFLVFNVVVIISMLGILGMSYFENTESITGVIGTGIVTMNLVVFTMFKLG